MEQDITRINPIEGIVTTLKEMATGLQKTKQLREDIFRDEWDDILVDTARAFDTGEWETGIYPSSESNCIIVEQYKDREDAQKGHTKWVAKMEQDPKRELKDIDLWNLGLK